MLARNGHPVRRLRTPIADQAPRAGETLFILEPQVMEPKEARALGRWVRGGGRLVVGDRGDVSWLKPILAQPPRWEQDGPVRRHVLAPTAETAGVREVVERRQRRLAPAGHDAAVPRTRRRARWR